jgi:hypothetical protein
MLDELFPLAITFPRFVKLENTRLTLLYWSLAVVVLFITTFSFVVTEGYYIYKTPSGTVQFWALDWKVTEDRAKQLNAAEGQKDYCRIPEKYEFCDDAECSWSARNLKCVDLCTEDADQSCMELSDRWIKTESSLFFPTFFEETSTRWMVDESTESAKRHVNTKWGIVKGVEDMSIGLDHEFRVTTPSQEQEEGSTRDGLLTVLQDSDGTEVARWEPGERIKLSLKQILEAGKINLDAVEKSIGRNLLAGGQIPDGILARLAGADITLQLSYQNPSSGPVCYISIDFRHWASQAQAHVVDHHGSTRFRNYQGVRIRFKSTGSFSWVSFDLISNKLTQCLVFFGVVKQIVFIFAITCLGVVSKVYKGFVYQKASLGREACGMAARLASHTSTFVELKDKEHGISEERLLRRFKRVFSHNHELDDGEIRRLVNWIFKKMAKDHNDGVDVQDFSHACTYGEALHFRTLVELFDADREKGFLERTFAGPQMRALYKLEDEYLKARASQKPDKIDLSQGTVEFGCQDSGCTEAPRKQNDHESINSVHIGQKIPYQDHYSLQVLEDTDEAQSALHINAGQCFPFCGSSVTPLNPALSQIVGCSSIFCEVDQIHANAQGYDQILANAQGYDAQHGGQHQAQHGGFPYPPSRV